MSFLWYQEFTTVSRFAYKGTTRNYHDLPRRLASLDWPKVEAGAEPRAAQNNGSPAC